MLKFSINRIMLRNRGLLFNTFKDNLLVWTGEKHPKITGCASKVPKCSNQSIVPIRKIHMDNQIRQNYHEESEDGINKHINLELYVSYVYLAMAYHFDRSDVALQRISKFFRKCSDEEREHAMKLMKFQNLRGGTVVLSDIKAPDKNKWENALEAMKDALELEKNVNQALLDLHKTASKHEDAHMADFLEKEYLHPQVKSIKEFENHVTNLKRVGPGLGEYIFDKILNNGNHFPSSWCLR